MKPTLIANANATAGGANGGNQNSAHTMTAGGANPAGNATNGINIPINHEYHYPSQQQHPTYHPQQYATADANAAAFGSPNSYARQQPQPQQPYSSPHHQQQIPAHFQQGFGFEPDMDMDMDMFPRSRLSGRMHDPFAGFGGSHFGFPQFGSMGRRRAPTGDPINDDHDFFNRLPSEFRQYIPENFGHRRTAGSAMPPQQPQPAPQPQYYQTYVPTGTTPPTASHMPQSPTKKLCDAAIQTEDLNVGRSEVDSAGPLQTDSLNQHGLRNTVDMGVKSAAENEMHGPRSHSAPPPEQLQQQQIPVNGKHPTPPPAGGRPQFSTQTSQPYLPAQGQQPHFQKAYYPPQQQSHPQQQQKQQTPPPPQTPGGSYVRTIPIFVEGRSEPIINSHKEIPNQNGNGNGGTGATATASARAGFAPPQAQQPTQATQQQQKYYQQPPVPPQHQQPQQQHRPTPLNTQQQPQAGGSAGPEGIPPQTPHTVDSINKIQDIQRDVLDLMGKVEKFGGTRKDKEYAYLDEMLTRNLLKLDTIDTNGKDSIRLARKEAIKCIQASINVLEAKAEENARNAAQSDEVPTETAAAESCEAQTKEDSVDDEAQPVDASKIQEPIPLPPPEGLQADGSSSNQAAAPKEATPPKDEIAAENTESK